MRRDRLVTVFVALASVTVCTVVVWLLWFRPVHEHTTIRTRTTPALIVVQPSTTPLQDSIREPRKTAATKRDGATSQRRDAGAPVRHGTASPERSRRRMSPRKRKTAKTRPTKRHPSQPGSSQPTQTPAPPATQPEPPPALSVPLPSICTKPIQIGTCP